MDAVQRPATPVRAAQRVQGWTRLAWVLLGPTTPSSHAGHWDPSGDDLNRSLDIYSSSLYFKLLVGPATFHALPQARLFIPLPHLPHTHCTHCSAHAFLLLFTVATTLHSIPTCHITVPTTPLVPVLPFFSPGSVLVMPGCTILPLHTHTHSRAVSTYNSIDAFSPDA